MEQGLLYFSNKEHSMTPDTSPIRSVETAFEIIQVIIARDGASLGELANELDKPKTTTHGYLKTLRNVDIVEKRDNQYRASSRLLDLGARVRNQLPLHRAAKPEVEALAKSTGQMASLMTEEQGEGVTLYTYGGIPELDIDVYPGLHSKIHTTSGGKAILAHLPQSRVMEIVDRHGLEPKTKETITNVNNLFDELEKIREQGYAVNSGERVIGMRSYGAAITDRDGHPVGAMVVFGPDTLLSDYNQTEQPIHELLLEAVNIVEVNLNYSSQR
jgi:IclR family acetate operon transcriptional repressor